MFRALNTSTQRPLEGLTPSARQCCRTLLSHFVREGEVPPEPQTLVCGLTGAAPRVFDVTAARMRDFRGNFPA